MPVHSWVINLVVEPFLTDLAADCPTSYFFKPSRSQPIGPPRCGNMNLRGFQQFTQYIIVEAELNTTTVKYQHILFTPSLLIKPIGQSSCSGLIDNTEDIEASNKPSILGSLPL